MLISLNDVWLSRVSSCRIFFQFRFLLALWIACSWLSVHHARRLYLYAIFEIVSADGLAFGNCARAECSIRWVEILRCSIAHRCSAQRKLTHRTCAYVPSKQATNHPRYYQRKPWPIRQFSRSRGLYCTTMRERVLLRTTPMAYTIVVKFTNGHSTCHNRRAQWITERASETLSFTFEKSGIVSGAQTH